MHSRSRHALRSRAARRGARSRSISSTCVAARVVADLPGYGYAAVPHALKRDWQELLWSYVTTRDTLIGLVLVVDARHGLRAQLDLELLAGFLPSGRPVLILATKADKLNQSERREAVAAIEDVAARRDFRDRRGGRARRRDSPHVAPQRRATEARATVVGAWLASALERPNGAADKEKGPAIKGSDAGPQNARAGEADAGTRSGRKAGDVHRPSDM